MTQPAINPDGRRHRKILFWMLVGTACVIFAAVQIRLNEVYREGWKAWNGQLQHILQRDRETRQQLSQLFAQFLQTHHRRNPNLTEVEQLINQGKPLGKSEFEKGYYRYVDPVTGGKASLRIENNEWDGTMKIAWALLNPGDVPIPNLGLYRVVITGRRIVYIVGYLSWCGAFALFVLLFASMDRRERIRWSERLLGVAIVSTFLSFLGLGYWRAWNAFFQDDAAGFGLLMIGISLALLLAARYRPRTSDSAPRCEGCGYNLTGNASGICPECGRGIAGQAPVS